jgi:hypothetical protein
VLDSDGTMICARCGVAHPPSEMEPSFKRPDDFFYSTVQVYRKSWANRSFCVLNRRRFFVRGVLPVRVVDQKDFFNIGVWAEVDGDTFVWARQHHRPRDFVRASLFWGRIANDMSQYLPGQSVGARVAIRFNRHTAPSFFLRFSGHPFEAEQRAGITAHRRAEIVELAFGREE